MAGVLVQKTGAGDQEKKNVVALGFRGCVRVPLLIVRPSYDSLNLDLGGYMHAHAPLQEGFYKGKSESSLYPWLLTPIPSSFLFAGSSRSWGSVVVRRQDTTAVCPWSQGQASSRWDLHTVTRFLWGHHRQELLYYGIIV